MEKKHLHTKEWKLLYLEGVTFPWNAPFNYHMITKHDYFHSIRMIHFIPPFIPSYQTLP
ncbi:hypothetical protein HanXRQr2_Chr12g0563671 [Helianthus annuus]|uniref:Uncharacterized protein n=1 Tax=Helianthus annuus TaxID=4232 RepID=A0A9K3MXV1_HELAN|nr:hypothetical protein HanXRQr2_Chr12g0563671 [Helianthus annuus]